MLKIKAEDNGKPVKNVWTIEFYTFRIKAKVKSSKMICTCNRTDKWIHNCTHLKIEGFKDRERPHKTWSGTVT